MLTAMPILPFLLSMIYFGKPVSAFPDHALDGSIDPVSPPVRCRMMAAAADCNAGERACFALRVKLA